MNRRIQVVLSLVGIVISTWNFPVSSLVRADERLFPPETQLYVVVRDLEQLLNKFEATEVGEMFYSEPMQAFRQDISRQLDERGTTKYRLGLSWDEIVELSQGELAFAYVHREPDSPVLAMVIDVKGKSERTQEVLANAAALLSEQGYTKRTVDHEGREITVFDPPDREPNQDQLERLTTKAFLRVDDSLIACESERLAAFIAGRIGAVDVDDSLAGTPAFKAVQTRCAEGDPEIEADVRWFVNPFGLIQASREDSPRLADKDQPQKDYLSIYREEGFDAIRAVAGRVQLRHEPFDLVHRMFIYAPKPYEKAMRMVELPNVDDLVPNPWRVEGGATVMLVNADLLQAFDHFGSLADKIIGDGEDGFWADLLDSWENDKYGPQINLRSELFEKLSGRMFGVTQYMRPITVDSERMLYLIQAEDAEQVTSALNKLMDGDPAVSTEQVADTAVYRVFKDEAQEGDPMMVVSSANGLLMAATHADIIEQLLRREQSSPLPESGRFQALDQRLQALASAKESSLYIVTQLEDQVEPYYQLFRTNQLAELRSLTMASSMIKELLTATNLEGPTQRFDGSALPEFDTIKEALGMFGSIGVSESDGWFLTGGLLGNQE